MGAICARLFIERPPKGNHVGKKEEFAIRRERLLHDREALVKKARQYLERGFFEPAARNTVQSLVEYHDQSKGMLSWKQWDALAGLVLYVDIADEDGEGDEE